MRKSKKAKVEEAQDSEATESVRLDKEVVKRVRQNKIQTGVPMGRFFEIAATEKLDAQEKKRK